jgi:hypothetical protein
MVQRNDASWKYAAHGSNVELGKDTGSRSSPEPEWVIIRSYAYTEPHIHAH